MQMSLNESECDTSSFRNVSFRRSNSSLSYDDMLKSQLRSTPDIDACEWAMISREWAGGARSWCRDHPKPLLAQIHSNCQPGWLEMGGVKITPLPSQPKKTRQPRCYASLKLRPTHWPTDWQRWSGKQLVYLKRSNPQHSGCIFFQNSCCSFNFVRW